MICRHEKNVSILRPKGHVLYECQSCGFIFVKKEISLTPKEIYKNYYKEGSGGRFGNYVELVVKLFRFLRAWKISFLSLSEKSILDIGSGRGWTLYFLRKYFGFKTASGIQIADSAYRFSKEKLKLEIFDQDFLELNFSNKFNLITLWHVLEHLENPEAYIMKIKDSLTPNGFLYLEVPNYSSWARRITGVHWLALDLKHHLYFFTPETLTSLLEKYGFQIKKINTFSLEYSTFTSIQSIVNYITQTDSYLFEWLQNRSFNLKIFLHIFLFTIFALPCFLINFFLYFSKSGEVITILAQKNEI